MVEITYKTIVVLGDDAGERRRIAQAVGRDRRCTFIAFPGGVQVASAVTAIADRLVRASQLSRYPPTFVVECPEWLCAGEFLGAIALEPAGIDLDVTNVVCAMDARRTYDAFCLPPQSDNDGCRAEVIRRALQVERATDLVLTNWSVLSDVALEVLLALLHQLNPEASHRLEGLGRLTFARPRYRADPSILAPSCAAILEGRPPTPAHPEINAILVRDIPALDPPRLNSFLHQAIDCDRYGRILRSGGIFSVSYRTGPLVLWNQIGARVEFTQHKHPSHGSSTGGPAIAFLGYQLDEGKLIAAFKASYVAD